MDFGFTERGVSGDVEQLPVGAHLAVAKDAKTPPIAGPPAEVLILVGCWRAESRCGRCGWLLAPPRSGDDHRAVVLEQLAG